MKVTKQGSRNCVILVSGMEESGYRERKWEEMDVRFDGI